MSKDEKKASMDKIKGVNSFQELRDVKPKDFAENVATVKKAFSLVSAQIGRALNSKTTMKDLRESKDGPNHDEISKKDKAAGKAFSVAMSIPGVNIVAALVGGAIMAKKWVSEKLGFDENQNKKSEAEKGAKKGNKDKDQGQNKSESSEKKPSKSINKSVKNVISKITGKVGKPSASKSNSAPKVGGASAVKKNTAKSR